MNLISKIGATAGASPSKSVGPAASSLLPAPDPVGLAGTQDALVVLYAMQNEQGAIEQRGASIAVEQNKQVIKVNLDRYMKALEAQRDAEREAHGFWSQLKSSAGTIAKIAGVVAGAAAVVASGGAGLPLVVGIAAVALSAGGTAVRELKLAGADSDKVSLGMEIAGAGIGLGGGIACALRAGAIAATATTTAARTTASAAQGVNAAATATSASAGVVVAGYQRDAEHARADAEDASGRMAIRQREIEWLIRVMSDAQQARSDSLETTRKAIEGCDKAADAAISGVRA